MAYRTRRAFRSQYELLLAASIVEDAASRLDEPRPFARRRRRLERDVANRRLAFAAQVQEFRRETLTLLAPADLLPEVGRLVLGHDEEAAAVADSTRRSGARTPTAALALAATLGRSSSYAATAAWAATADELATRGISNRPSLIFAELVALVLTPIAIFHCPEPRKHE